MNQIAEANIMVISKVDNKEPKIANDDKTTPVSRTKRKRLQGKTTTESDCESPEACLDSDTITIVYSHLLAVPEIKEALSKFENVGARRESVNRKNFADSTSIWLDLVNQLESEYRTVKGVLAQLAFDYPVLSRHPAFAAVVAEDIDATKPNVGNADINSMKTN